MLPRKNKGWLIMQQISFYELMKASQSFAEAAASLANAFADANQDFIEKKDVLSCSKFHLSLAISEYKRGEYYLTSDYARNFIYDFILGEKQNIGQLEIF